MRGREYDGVTRREFIQAGAAVGLGLAAWQGAAAAPMPRAKACIQLMLVGGPSQLDTWDSKPSAPEEIRGPFRSIRTNVPGIDLSELFPQLARRADRFALLRSVHHQDAPIHETGLQLLQTGRLSPRGREWPHLGLALDEVCPSHSDAPPWVLLPGPIRSTGVDMGHGQSAGFLAERFDTLRLDSSSATYTFGQCCELARRLVEQGVRMVTVNMFHTVFNQTTWDCHANGGDLTSALSDYPQLSAILDGALSALLDELESRGLLETTLVVCMGEFGRTPRVNRNFGRDHWSSCWSALMAGGGVRGGQVIGASDAHAAEPRSRPIHAAEIAATICHALGVDPRTPIADPHGRALPLVDAAPITELF